MPESKFKDPFETAAFVTAKFVESLRKQPSGGKVPLSKPSIDHEELEAIRRVSEDGCLAGTCEEVRLFEKEFAAFVGARYAVATSSCTTALHVACLALGVGRKSRVIVPSYTFPATAFAPMYCGAQPTIMDIDQDTWNIDVGAIKRSMVSKYTDVIIPVHCFGNPAPMNEIMGLAHDTDARVIEDAACALPAYLDRKHCGIFGDIGCYSFYAIKNLCTGEGGMLVTDDGEIAEKARRLVDFGKTTSKPLPQFTQLGYNYRLSALQAAMGRVQLKKLSWMHDRRVGIAACYDDFLEDQLKGIATPQLVLDSCESAYQRYAIVLSEDYARDIVMGKLAELGVQTAIGTYDLSSQPVFGDMTSPLPVSGRVFRQSISLPMYPDLTDEQAEYVCESLKKVL